MKIEDQPLDSRPYEKFEKYGPKYLTDTELLGILIRTGTKELNAVQLAEKLIAVEYKPTSLLRLYDNTLESLMLIKGIGRVKAIQILALLELSKRLSKERYTYAKITKPEDVAKLYMEELRHEKQECFIAIGLDVKNKIVYSKTISKGNLTSSIVHPREVYKFAITQSAYSIMVLHNHPSGDPMPSKEDIEITKRLQSVGTLIGIPLLDHIIVGDGVFISLKELGQC